MIWAKFPLLGGLFVLSLILSFPIHSQDLNSCLTIVYDPDGDGFGWDPYEQSSCVVNDETSPAPTIVNRETGAVIIPERSYWDGNADFANREIQCDFFEFRESTQQYTLDRSYRYWHLPLPDQPPWVSGYYVYTANGEIRNTLPIEHDEHFVTGTWSMAFGIRVIAGFANVHVGSFWSDREFPLRTWSQTVVYPDGKQAIRNWKTSNYQNPIYNEYQDCYYTSGELLQPTGHWNQPATSSNGALTEDPLLFTGKIEPKPEIINLATAQPVKFETGFWDMQADFINKEINCDDIVWFNGEYSFNNIAGPVFEYAFLPRLSQYPNTGIINRSYDFVSSGGQWKIEDNVIDALFPPSQWFEAIARDDGTEGVRFWRTESAYIDCYAWDHGSSLIHANREPVSFRPSRDFLPEDTTGVTDTNNTDNTDNTDNNQSDINPQLTPQNDSSGITDGELPDTVITSGGGGSFSIFLLFILVACYGFRPSFLLIPASETRDS